jgi:hypothetical protein
VGPPGGQWHATSVRNWRVLNLGPSLDLKLAVRARTGCGAPSVGPTGPFDPAGSPGVGALFGK